MKTNQFLTLGNNFFSYELLRATPPVKRRPCLGRNINDSDADLYAEYHGNGTSSDPEEDDPQGPRLRSSRQPQGVQPLPLKGRNLFQNQPNLQATIQTNFSKAPPSPVNHISPTSLDPPSVFTPECSPLPGSSNVSVESSRGAFDFQSWFQPVYNEHAQYLKENPPKDGDVFSETRARSWSAGESSLISRSFCY